jgi:putative ABC transport system permease protein
MIFFTLIREALAAIWANRLRSTLTTLGMVMGVTSVIAIVSSVEGMQSNIEDAIQSLGSNTFLVTRFGMNLSSDEFLRRMKRKKLTRGLITPIEDACPDCGYVGAEGYSSDNVKYEAKKLRQVEIDGQTPNIMAMRDLDVKMGRYISWEDDRRRLQVAFLGHRIYESLFGKGTDIDPVGKKIKIGRREFTIIGVAEAVGGLVGEDMDSFIVVPLSTLQKLYSQPGNPVNLIISAASLSQRQAAMDEVRVALRSARHLDYEEDDDFTILTPEAILKAVNDITIGFRAVLISLPLLSIIIGGIVIMNIMMISVTERTREIGIRKSIGAKRRHILVQFLYESLVISLVGGALGIFFGAILGRTVLVKLMDINVSPTGLAIILGVGISTAVGLFFGIYPALKASKFDPIRALSYE